MQLYAGVNHGASSTVQSFSCSGPLTDLAGTQRGHEKAKPRRRRDSAVTRGSAPRLVVADCTGVPRTGMPLDVRARGAPGGAA
jgi:hypothetical protein